MLPLAVATRLGVVMFERDVGVGRKTVVTMVVNLLPVPWEFLPGEVCDEQVEAPKDISQLIPRSVAQTFLSAFLNRRDGSQRLLDGTEILSAQILVIAPAALQRERGWDPLLNTLRAAINAVLKKESALCQVNFEFIAPAELEIARKKLAQQADSRETVAA